MFSYRKAIGSFFLLVMVTLLVACQPRTPVEPTLDAQAIYTAAAQTVQAELTQSALLTPQATNTIPPTATLEQVIPTLAPINSNDNSSATATGTPVVVFTLAPVPGAATATLAVAGGAAADKAEWVSNDPPDGALVLPKAAFDIVWTVRNTGTTTWNKNYVARFFIGTKFHEASSYAIREEVKPGATTRIIVDAIAPSTVGDYQTWWKLTNDQGQNFGDLTLNIRVVEKVVTNTP